MKKVSFEGIGAVVATCQVDGEFEGRKLVKVVDNGKVAVCTDEEKFCGLAMAPRGGITSVQFRGFMTVPYTGSLNYGWTTLVATDKYGVKTADNGVVAQVVAIDEDRGVAVICL